MRGKGKGSAGSGRSSWITPAYAGKSTALVTAIVRSMGSPPRMRGKEKKSGKAATTGGITPAYAGKSVFRCSVATGDWDHPRVCGEKYFSKVIIDPVMGSPPRMRGKD